MCFNKLSLLTYLPIQSIQYSVKSICVEAYLNIELLP